MIEFTFWDILRNLLLATRWTIVLSLIAFVGGATVGLVLTFMRLSSNRWLHSCASLNRCLLSHPTANLSRC